MFFFLILILHLIVHRLHTGTAFYIIILKRIYLVCKQAGQYSSIVRSGNLNVCIKLYINFNIGPYGNIKKKASGLFL